MADSGAELSLHDQIKLASEWGYNQDEIIAALKANSTKYSKEYERFENCDVMLDFLNKISGRNIIGNNNNNTKDFNSNQSDVMTSSSSTSSLLLPQCSSSPKRNFSVGRSSSFHLSTPRSTRDSADIVRLLTTLEKEKERDRKEVEHQFDILKNRITHLEDEKDKLIQEIHELKFTIDSQEFEIKSSKDEISKLMEEKMEATEALDKLTIQNYRHQQEVHDQKELAEHRKKTYMEDKLKKDEEIANLQKRTIELELELENKNSQLDAQTGIAKQLEQQKYQLQPLVLLEDLNKKQSQLVELTSRLTPGIDEIKLLYKQLFDTFPEMEENIRKERDESLKKVNEMEEKLNSKNRDLQRLQEKCVTECCICLNTKPSIVFLPCRHMISCSDCYSNSDLRECPTCRSTIDNSITVFI